MTNAILEKRFAKLEREVRSLRSAIPAVSRLRTTLPIDKRFLAMVKAAEREMASPSFKKLPRGVQAGLRDAAAGRISGPFDSAEELIASLKS